MRGDLDQIRFSFVEDVRERAEQVDHWVKTALGEQEPVTWTNEPYCRGQAVAGRIGQACRLRGNRSCRDRGPALGDPEWNRAWRFDWFPTCFGADSGSVYFGAK
jgi:hypothetical protein